MNQTVIHTDIETKGEEHFSAIHLLCACWALTLEKCGANCKQWKVQRFNWQILRWLIKLAFFKISLIAPKWLLGDPNKRSDEGKAIRTNKVVRKNLMCHWSHRNIPNYSIGSGGFWDFWQTRYIHRAPDWTLEISKISTTNV